MDIALFLKNLFDTGVTSIPPGPTALPMSPAGRRLLHSSYQADACHFPGEMPSYDAAVAEACACWFAAAAMCLVDRSMDEASMRHSLDRSAEIPAANSPSACCSADLVLRYLPGLYQLARQKSESDPLLDCLTSMAQRWPLSSPGVPGSSAPKPEVIQILRSHPGTWRLYLDRVARHRHAEALQEPSVLNALIAEESELVLLHRGTTSAKSASSTL